MSAQVDGYVVSASRPTAIRAVTMAEHGETRPHYIQKLFTIFTNANNVMWGVVGGGHNTVRGSFMEINKASNKTDGCKAAEGLFVVVVTGAVWATSARIDLFPESVTVGRLTKALLRERNHS